jgi:hypothetical protein
MGTPSCLTGLGVTPSRSTDPRVNPHSRLPRKTSSRKLEPSSAWHLRTELVERERERERETGESWLAGGRAAAVSNHGNMAAWQSGNRRNCRSLCVAQVQRHWGWMMWADALGLVGPHQLTELDLHVRATGSLKTGVSRVGFGFWRDQ